ncbi:uncharacterized protein LOC105204810 [Solenopsis invicta]|uniref:uncharacterized protein LOC105204810 n=1 Tax=Solenopsis invicta TaxID=13686 RepID=UPI000E33DCD6|nr:uncharacterized protein LOC105204810 [Solenopsis invicta]
MELDDKSFTSCHTLSNDFFFYATVCHVCKKFGDNVSLKRCSGCRMIAYCGREHQKRHWTLHKPLCNAIQDVLREYSMEGHDVTSQEWNNVKLNFMLLVSIKLKRVLERSEIQLLTFPRECEVCHERNGRLLEDCQDCLSVSFCKDHRDSIKHKDFCYALKLCFHLSLTDASEDQPVKLSYLRHISNIDTFRDMKDFLKIYLNIKKRTFSNMQNDILLARHSHYFSPSLTLFHAVKILDFAPKYRTLIIHVVGANNVEESTIPAWEVLLHLMPAISLITIVMIGPELTVDSNKFQLSMCDDCIAQKKKIEFSLNQSLYTHYVQSPLFLKPDLIVGFTIGLHEFEFESKMETWAPSIKVLAKQNCPFILTCYKGEIEKEIGRLNAILDRKVDFLYSGNNPFASLRPQRNFGSEMVFYWNYNLTVYRSFCL